MSDVNRDEFRGMALPPEFFDVSSAALLNSQAPSAEDVVAALASILLSDLESDAEPSVDG